MPKTNTPAAGPQRMSHHRRLGIVTAVSAALFASATPAWALLNPPPEGATVVANNTTSIGSNTWFTDGDCNPKKVNVNAEVAVGAIRNGRIFVKKLFLDFVGDRGGQVGILSVAGKHGTGEPFRYRPRGAGGPLQYIKLAPPRTRITYVINHEFASVVTFEARALLSRYSGEPGVGCVDTTGAGDSALFDIKPR